MVQIVGAGFSGLSLAYYLNQLGIEAEIFETSGEVGGLIHTHHHALGIVETAANALLWTPALDRMCRDLGVELCTSDRAARKRFIYVGKEMHRWPLSFHANLKLLNVVFAMVVRKSKQYSPRPKESVKEFILRTLSKEILENLVAPALQGIYAGDVEKMSARLVFGRFTGMPMQDVHGLDFSRLAKGYKRSVAPVQGMGQLIHALENRLSSRGVRIHKKQNSVQLRPVCVLATSGWDAAHLLEPSFAKLSARLKQIESLGVVSVTQFFASAGGRKQGFGCLFPRGEGVRSLGVLFNTFIFPGRSSGHSETWILGGAHDPEVLNCTDAQILEALREDRRAVYGVDDSFLDYQITRWPKALPHYTLRHEEILETLEVPQGIYLHGNYLGRLGLSQILDRSRLLAAKIAKDECK